MTAALPYIAIVVLIVLSAYFSGTEIAFTGVNRVKLTHAAENGSKSAAAALKIADGFENALSTILIGNNLVNTAASSVATVLAIRIAGDSGAAAATFIMVVLILIFGEIVPKTVASKRAEGFAMFSAFPLRALIWLMTPVTAVVLWVVRHITNRLQNGEETEAPPTATEEELVTLIETIEQEGVIDEEKSDLLQSAIEFNTTTVGEIQTPRINVTFIDIDDTTDEIRRTADESRYSRLPVYRDTVDNIVGILHLNQFYKALTDGQTSVESILSESLCIHRTMKLPAALSMMKEKRVHLAVVVDEYGGTDGIVTMEDILEQLVGEIWDESDEIIPEYTKVDENTYSVKGEMSLSDLFELTDTDDRDLETDCTTVGGWAAETLESAPHLDDRFDYKNLHFTVTEIEDEIYVNRLTVTVEPEDEEEDLKTDKSEKADQ